VKLLTIEQRRFAVELHLGGEHTQAAIAELLGTTQGNISKVLAAARRRDAKIPTRRRTSDSDSRPLTIFAASQLGSRREPLNMDSL
jgi:DNA-binding MarR family transcriptional regulator